MDKHIIPLPQLTAKTKAKIYEIQGGLNFQRKLGIMGIRKNQYITIMSKQPFRGPITIQINGCMMTMGQGMAQKILVEVIG